MNNISEIFNKDNQSIQSNYLKQIKNTYMSNNIFSNNFNNIKTNNNNNYIYFSNNTNHIINNIQQNYFYFVDTEVIDKLSKKIMDKQNQYNQINISKSEKIKNSKKASFDCSKENIKNINLLEESYKKDMPKALSNDQKNKNILDSLSEVKKFKTELCHSWELTGTCKYGENVNIIYIII